ncbi:MAG: triose-phosphate isomerase [bacterium]
MRKPMMAGNWKMNKTRDEALQFIFAVNQELPDSSLVDTVIFSQPVLLRCLVKRQGEQLRIGAQNMHYEDSGAFTGEVSPKLLNQTGVEYAILGHSERRKMYNETSEAVNKKMIAALNNEITPIVCCGETPEEREAGLLVDRITYQITKAYKDINPMDVPKTVVAYEPIWAVGTGVTASPEVADEACGLVRSVIKKLYGASISEEIRILYGGSVTLSNIDDILSKENIDGALVGGASLDPDTFIELAKKCVK